MILTVAVLYMDPFWSLPHLGLWVLLCVVDNLDDRGALSVAAALMYVMKYALLHFSMPTTGSAGKDVTGRNTVFARRRNEAPLARFSVRVSNDALGLP